MTVTNTGVAEVANLIIGSGTAFSYLGIGTGTTASGATDTALETETQREAATTSRVTTDVTNDTSQFVYTFSFSGSEAVTEAGVLNAASVGTLLARQVFSAINVVSGDSLQVTYKVDLD